MVYPVVPAKKGLYEMIGVKNKEELDNGNDNYRKNSSSPMLG